MDKFIARVRAIDANNNKSSWSAVRSFTTLSAPSLLWPDITSKNVSLNPILTWKFLSGVTKYQCEFDSVPTFNSPWHKSGIIQDDNKFQVFGNNFGEEYFFRVRGIHINDTSDWSTPFNFFTKDSTDFYPTSIFNGDSGVHPVDTIRVYGIMGTKKYEINFSNEPSFLNPIVFYWDSAAIMLKKVGAKYDTIARGAIDTIPFGDFYYRVRLLIPGDTSKWTSVRTLKTIKKVVLKTPANGASTIDPGTSFTWDPIRKAWYYILEYDTSATF